MGDARQGVIEAELEARGLSPRAAGRLAALWISQHPLACRNGWETVRRGLERGGVAPGVARETALTLLALELLFSGWSFPAVVGRLDSLHLAVGEARGAAHEAVRIQRVIDTRGRRTARG
jgi:hypothetical protein